MSVSARSYVAAGVAALTAGVIAIPTSVAPPALPPTPVHQARVALAAATRPITAPVESPVAFVVVPRQQTVAATASATRAATQASPTAAVTAAAPAAQAALAGFPGIQDAIINAYNLVIPWVNYGVNLAQYAVGWIPVAGIFAPQIGIFYYNLIEPILTSAVYNVAYVIGGSLGLVQGVSNVINDSINAGIGFVNAEINWALSFLPPFPPLPLAAAQTTVFKTAEVTAAPATEATDDVAPQAPIDAATVEKHESSVADSAATAADAPAEPAEPASAETPTGGATEAAAEPVTPKPEAEPAKKPESATTDSSGGVAAQGEVRGGTDSAADAKRPEEKKPDASKTHGKGAEDAASAAAKPAESGPNDDAKTSDDAKT